MNVQSPDAYIQKGNWPHEN